LPDDPDQKKESMATMLAGFCAYLNRVAYHCERGRAGVGELLSRMPLDHWESEAAVASSQILLTMAMRTLARNKT